MIQCRNVVKIHRGRGLDGLKRGFKAVDDVSFSIEKNGNFGLVGESGCGKTTLARAILYLDPPTSGKVIFDGVDLGSLGLRQLRTFRRRMQIVFQDPHSSLDPRMTVYDSLSEGLINIGVDRVDRTKKISRLLDLVGISSTLSSRFPHEFSTGQRQRIVIARALTMDPEFLILDEPVSNLDVSIQAQVINLLLDIKQELKLTYLFISHDINLVAYMCDRIAVMYRGKIVEQSPTDELFSNPKNEYTRMLLASIPGSSGLSDAIDADIARGGSIENTARHVVSNSTSRTSDEPDIAEGTR
ncbi:MAG TPA: ABC transporter ATP-binding protein [Spirochaetaceae bacterium]|nr:ABC transporter ATP-binding protein [Spirochaetaceae bacterium]